MGGSFSRARGVEKFFRTQCRRVPTITEKPDAAMVNGEVMGTAGSALTLPGAAGVGAATELLAGEEFCWYRLDFKQLVYLFGLQWRVPEMET
jgi:hypothetical protein